MKKAGSALVLVLLALALAACGGGSDTTDTEATAGGEAAGGAAGGEEAAAGGGSAVAIEAVDSGLEYTTDEATAKAGEVTIEFTNPQAIAHDVAVENDEGETIGKTELIADDKTTATIGDLEPGEYTFYCTVPGHREAGMEGTLKVE